MSRKLEGKSAIVTGAASGMGEAIARAFLENGARVLIVDRDDAKLAEVRDGLGRAGLSEFETFKADVMDGAAIESAVGRAVAAFGALDVMCNNAGIAPDIAIEEMTEEEWDLVTGVNHRAVWLGIKYSAKAMKQTGGGSIINTASMSGHFPRAGHAAYGSAKAGAIHLTRIAAVELGRYRIRCNSISPGCIATPMNYADPRFPIGKEVIERVFADIQPIPRSGQVADIAAMALFLASDESSFVSGQNIGVDGGGVMFDNGTLPELVEKAKADLAAEKTAV